MRGIGVLVLTLAVIGCAAPATSAPPASTGPVPSAEATRAAAPSPTAVCTIAWDRPPAVSQTVYLTGTGFKPNVDMDVTFDAGTASEEKLPVINPGMHTSADGRMGPTDVTYTSPSDAGRHSVTATDGACTATLEYTIPSPFSAAPS